MSLKRDGPFIKLQVGPLALTLSKCEIPAIYTQAYDPIKYFNMLY